MNLLIFLFVFIIGTIIGSFLNVVIYRFNTGKTIVSGRSMCMSCSNTLRWYELIPVFSFLIQSGRCRQCASRISHQYPIVELITGIIFVLISFKLLPFLFMSFWMYLFFLVFFVFIFCLLIVISVYDIRHKIIPDKLVYTFILVSLFSIFINYSMFGGFLTIPSLDSLLAGPILALPFALLWYLSKGKLMGLGDGKLVLGIGWLLGLSAGFSAVIISFWLGSIIGLSLMIFTKKRKNINMKTEIPFAPFLIVGTFLVFLFNIDILSIIKSFGI